MTTVIRPASFEEWIEAIFDHPVPTGSGEAWYWDIDMYVEELTSSTGVEYFTRLFLEGHTCLRRFTNDQIGQALWYLNDPSCSDHARCVLNLDVNESVRNRCLESIPVFFEKVLAARGENKMDSYVTDDDEVVLINQAFFMWWDVSPICPGNLLPKQIEICFDSMQRILSIDHIACQKSALHGLGHWHDDNPERVEEIIDAFIANNPEMNPDLLTYARQARTGYIQ